MKIPAPALAVSAMLSVQTGAALSTHLFKALTPAGSAWLRLAISAIFLLLITRPRPRAVGWPALRGTLLLGTVTAVLTLAFIEAVARIPLGTAAAIEFLGPLGVAAIRSHRRSALVWPALALAGVIGLTEPWHGQLNLSGVGFAVAAAFGWAGYIVLTQRVGAQLTGLQGLAMSLGTAAIVAAPVAAWPALHGLTPGIALQGLGLAALVPLLPFSLELLALRRMRVAAFGTLMALEPGIAVVIGLLLLGQLPTVWQIGGVALVVTAGVGAQRVAPAATAKPPTSAGKPAGSPRLLAERAANELQACRCDSFGEPHLLHRHVAEADETGFPLGAQLGQGLDALGEVDRRAITAVQLIQVNAAPPQGSEAEFTVAAQRGRAGVDGEVVGAAPEMTTLGGNQDLIPAGVSRQRPGDDPLVLGLVI